MEATLTVEQAYRAMVAFLKSYVDDTHSREVDSWMFGLRLGPSGETGDPGTWDAWCDAVRHVVGDERGAVSQPEGYAIARQFLAVFASETSSAEFHSLVGAMGDPRKGGETREWRRWLEAARGV